MSTTIQRASGSLVELNFRPFDENDWDCYAGATDIAPGIPPFICETDFATFIADGAGREVSFEDGQTFVTHDRDLPWPSSPAQAVQLRWEQTL